MSAAVEICKIYHGFGRQIVDSVKFRGLEHYEKAFAKKKGRVFYGGHCGNWELMALPPAVHINNGSVVARRQNNPYLNTLVEKVRGKFGSRAIYKSGALKAMISEFRKTALSAF